MSLEDCRYAFILISDVKYWNRLCEQNRNREGIQAFVRKNHVGPVATQKLLFYVKRPMMQIRGVADFIERLAGDYEELWKKYGGESCFESFNEYCTFIHNRRIVTFVRFKNFMELKHPVTSDVIAKVLGLPKVPRGGKYINRETANQLTV